MQRRIKSLLKSKITLWGIIPLLLLGLWVGLTMLYIVHLDTAFSVLSYNEPNSSFTNLTYNKLLKGQSVDGSFTAEDNNLGIVAIRFQTFFRPAYDNEDRLLFQIKQKGAKTWYYQNTYRDGLIYDMPFFPFGFPIIADSQGKTYEFRITSLRGDEGNSVAISRGGQILATKYKYTKSQLLHNKKLLLTFSVRKFINAMQTQDVLFSSLVYLLPLIFYIVILLCRKSVHRHLQKWWKIVQKAGKSKLLAKLLPEVSVADRVPVLFIDSILLVVSIVDAFYLQLGSDAIYLLVPILWIIMQRIFGVGSKGAFLIGIGMLFLPPLFLAFSLSQTAEQIAVYAYLFLVAGFVQALMELKETEK